MWLASSRFSRCLDAEAALAPAPPSRRVERIVLARESARVYLRSRYPAGLSLWVPGPDYEVLVASAGVSVGAVLSPRSTVVEDHLDLVFLGLWGRCARWGARVLDV